MYILNELGNLLRSLIITQRDAVPRQAGKLVEKRNESLQILLDCQMEGIAILEIDGNAEAGADFLEREELARCGIWEPAQVAGEEGGEDLDDMRSARVLSAGRKSFWWWRTVPCISRDQA